MKLANGEHYVLNNETRAIFPIPHDEDLLDELRFMLARRKVSIVRVDANHNQGYEVLSADKYDRVFQSIKQKAEVAIEQNRVQESIKDYIVKPDIDSKKTPIVQSQKAAA